MVHGPIFVENPDGSITEAGLERQHGTKVLDEFKVESNLEMSWNV